MASATGHIEKLYREMFLIRRFEEEAARAYAQGKIGGFLHLYIGQESIAVGAVAALKADDYVITSYRDHGLALARGMSAGACMAELYGKDTGCSRGLGGSMHMFDVEHYFYGGHAIVGGHIPLASGMAFKSKYTGDGRVTACFFGDGATNISGFHEGISLAAIWKLPAIFVCENNLYSMGTPLERTSPVKEIVQRAAGYGIERARFDAHDVLDVEKQFAKAAEYARSGKGPVFLEALTYRFRGHSMSDPGKYRTREELDEAKNRDPVLMARAQLLKSGASEATVGALEAEVEKQVAEAVAFAEASEPAKPESIDAFIYAPNDGQSTIHVRSSGGDASEAAAQSALRSSPSSFIN